jgi:glycosyltransferase involved in cell wall biosynthesis
MSRLHKNDYIVYTAFDPQGLIFCKELFPKAKPFYYSLELYLKDDHSGLLYSEEIMQRERQAVKSISGLIIQSEEKESLFRHDYALSSEIKSFILPVAYSGTAIRIKNDYLHQKYQIDKNKKIMLHLGGINSYFSCKEFAAQFNNFPDWVVFFQGRGENKYIKEIKSVADNVVFSSEYFDEPEDVNVVLQSSHAGIAWYNDISAGFRTAGKSSGKISAYMRFGLPIISKKYPSTYSAIEEQGCGKCIDDIEEFPSAIEYIDKNYDILSENCYNEYDKKYNFNNYSANLKKFLQIAND